MNHYHYHYHYEILDYFTSTRRKLHSCSCKIRSSVAYSQITNIIFPRVKTELYESPSPFSAMSDYNNKKKKKRNKSGPSVDVLCVALAWCLDQYTTMSSISNRLITIWITDERSNWKMIWRVLMCLKQVLLFVWSSVVLEPPASILQNDLIWAILLHSNINNVFFCRDQDGLEIRQRVLWSLGFIIQEYIF
jgi:hypothetical protein